MTQECTCCKEKLDESLFNVCSSRKTKLTTQYKNCLKRKRILKKEEIKGENIIKIFKDRIRGIKQRSNQDIDESINIEYLINLFYKQNKKCAVSGIEMTTLYNSGRVPTNVSVDRINSKLPYTKDNIQLVCMAVNVMKSDLGIDDLIYFCSNILQYNSKIVNYNL